MPRHIAIIMDGNGRWAYAKGLERTAGHRQGLQAARNTVATCHANGIKYLTLFAFSTDNWRRPDSEIKVLLDLLTDGLRNNLKDLQDNNVRIRFIGDLSSFPRRLRTALDHFEASTVDNDGIYLQIALNYSGRWDIVEAVHRLADMGHNMSMVTEAQLSEQLATADLPDPDLFIRTSGELRLSNFMLWQTAYAEMFFTETLWPDFSDADLNAALEAYARRERRFGGIEKIAQKMG